MFRALIAAFLLLCGAHLCSALTTTLNLTNEARSYLAHLSASSQRSYQKSGTIIPIGSYTSRQATNPDLQKRRLEIKQAVIHAWDGYASVAWGSDELLPLSRKGGETFAEGLGTTIIDSLTTLYIMGGLDGRYEAARKWVAEKLDFGRVGRIIVFETVIRILGGLLSMFHLSGDEMYLEKADELGARLAASFDTPTGYPWPRCYLNETGRCEPHQSMGDSLYLAEVGTVQLEYRALSHHSSHPLSRRMREVTEEIIQRLQVAGSISARLSGEHAAMLPFAINRVSGNYSTNLVTMGAPADSYFEYLVKVWVQGGRKEQVYWDLFASVVDSMSSIGTYTSRHGDTIIRDLLPTHDGSILYSHKMDHFACYAPGMIILGLDGLGEHEKERRAKWEKLAEAITETCYKMYVNSPSGLAGENIRLGNADEWKTNGGYHLRPEAVEAFFYMYRHTRKEKYREYAWSVFKQIEEHCRMDSGGYAAIKSARSRRPKKEDVMHSFLISETFKYIYLIFGDDEDELALDKWVFNTEAHPLLITPSLGERLDKPEGEDHDVSKVDTYVHDEL